MIENFTKEQFESALPVGFWRSAGVQYGQEAYYVVPFPSLPFMILVLSSIQGPGSGREAGKDSIRCRIVNMEGKPVGGKPVRWIDRRRGWADRLRDYLRSLSNQISWLKLRCPCCQGALLPFTSQKGKAENKGRPFVCCKNEGCKHPFFAWTESEEGAFIRPTGPAPVQPAPTTGNGAGAGAATEQSAEQPTCPKCGSAMVRMSSGKGWRCAVQGNKWADGAWSICDGVQWDRKEPTKTVQEQPAPTTTTNVPGFKGDAERLKSVIKCAIGWIDDGEEGAMEQVRALLSGILE